MKTIMEAISQRHSVRRYLQKPIEGETLAQLEKMIDDCNQQSGLHMQLVRNEPQAFDSRLAHYGHFSNVSNYIALIGPKSEYLEEKCGYYGEKIVLEAQRLGLNTCWVALTFRKIPSVFTVSKGEKFVMVIAIGYGENQGVPHRERPLSSFYKADQTPKWFMDGIYAVSLAPSAMHQQKYTFSLDGNQVIAAAGRGFCTKTDLGIAKYHFECGAGKDHFEWRSL